MSIVKAIENIELERSNNGQFARAVVSRLESLKARTEALQSQATASAEQLAAQLVDINAAIVSTQMEFTQRDEALRVIIEGDGNAT
jgi:hypothetical protein